MPQAHADPERIRGFANALWAFAQDTDARGGELSNQLGRLHESWRDQEYEIFCQHFQRTRQVLQAFSEEVKKVVPSLREDAEKLQEYINERLNR